MKLFQAWTNGLKTGSDKDVPILRLIRLLLENVEKCVFPVYELEYPLPCKFDYGCERTQETEDSLVFDFGFVLVSFATTKGVDRSKR